MSVHNAAHEPPVAKSGLTRRQALLRGAGLVVAVSTSATLLEPRPTPAAAGYLTLQDDWQWCRNCMGLFYLGSGNHGSCPDGGGHSRGGHDSTGSGNYGVAITKWENTVHMQTNWQWCRICMGLFYLGSGNHGTCPGTDGRSHDSTGSGQYWMWQYCPC